MFFKFYFLPVDVQNLSAFYSVGRWFGLLRQLFEEVSYSKAHLFPG